jgi:hypothetical protein
MIDANENISNPDENGFMEVINRCGLVNAYQDCHGSMEEFPTHINDSRNIDYMLVTKM